MPLRREHLEALDKDALINLILQLAARVAQLEARLAQNSQNSSRPPSSDPPFPKMVPPSQGTKANKKSGAQPGHQGHGLKKVAQPDRIEEYLPHQCLHCGYCLDEEPAIPAGSFQVFDVPIDIKIEVLEHRRFARRCPWCQKRNQGQLPPWLSPEAPCQWGPRCRALGVYLMHQHHLPYQRTQAIFVDLFGAAPSEGTLFNWLRVSSERLAPVETQIAQALVQSARVGADETPARGAGWLHTLVSEHWTWYGSHQKRGREAMEHFGLLPRYRGLLMSDCLSSYAIYGAERSLCCAHLLRDLTGVYEQGHLWAQRMIGLLLWLKERVASVGAPLARSSLHALYRWFGRLLSMGQRENRASPVDKSLCLLSRLEARRDEYLRFATTAGAWFDNNISERALRMMKLHLKVSGCFRSALGCQILCRVRGYLSTMKKQGQALLPALVSVMEGKPLLPPLLHNNN